MAKTPFKGVFITHDYAKHLEKVKGLYGEKGIHTHATAAGHMFIHKYE